MPLSRDINAPALPNSFLGRSAPRLQQFPLCGIPFPALPKLLLSTRDLVHLDLSRMPRSGIISPKVMVRCLSLLTRLESLSLGFRSPRSRAYRENRLRPRMTPIVLPALTSFKFKGDSEYLEDIVSQIDTPLLDQLHVTFFNRRRLDTRLLRHLVNRTETFKALPRADVHVYNSGVDIKFFPRDETDHHDKLSLSISFRSPDWRLSSLARVFKLVLSPITALERLDIKDYQRGCEDDAEDTPLHELLHPFTSVKVLALYGEVVQLFTPVLDSEELAGESVTGVLPALQYLFLQSPPPSVPDRKAIGRFAAARKLSGRPVAVYRRDWRIYPWQQVRWGVGD